MADEKKEYKNEYKYGQVQIIQLEGKNQIAVRKVVSVNKETKKEYSNIEVMSGFEGNMGGFICGKTPFKTDAKRLQLPLKLTDAQIKAVANAMAIVRDEKL